MSRKYFKTAHFVLPQLLCVALMFGAGTSNAYGSFFSTQALSDTSEVEKAIVIEDVFTSSTYSYVKKQYETQGYEPTKGVRLEYDAAAVTASDTGRIPIVEKDGRKSVLHWDDTNEWFEYTVNIPEDGLYNMAFEYYPLEGTGGWIQRALYIDGESLFDEANNISVPRLWRDEGEPKINNIGDEVWPKQLEDFGWRTHSFYDNQGYYSEPLRFYMSKGEHVIKLELVDQPVMIGSFIIYSPEELPTYAEVKAEYAARGYRNATQGVKFQAELNADVKSDPTIRRENNQDPLTEPRSLGDRKLNVMGGERWKTGSQFINWKFEVPEDGLYKIDVKVLQSYNDGLSSYRKIEIDGEVPFRELAAYSFAYDKYWRIETLNDDSGEPYLFYLTKGMHELRMTAVMGPVTEIIQRIMDDTLLLSKIYRNVVMITGQSPDTNYDYELDRTIPGIMEALSYLSDSMQFSTDKLMELSAKRPSAASNFQTIKAQLQKMITNPDYISRNLASLSNAQNNLGTWMLNLKNQQLMVDYIVINPPGAQEKNARSNFLQRMETTAFNFLTSFTKDYDSIGSVYESADEQVIDVWVMRGKEWAEIMKELADEEFTRQTGISINLNVIPASQANAGDVNALMLAVTSGRAPDVALGTSSDVPVEFAIRTAVHDLSSFPDFNEVFERFYPSIMIPLEYGGKTYGLPETMDFQVLFYRKDVFEEIGLTPPNTWNDLYETTLPRLYQNSMQFYYGGGFAPILFQHGGNYYDSLGLRSDLGSKQAYEAFKAWTELYTSYGVPVETNFYNHMRVGDTPVGIANYAHYMQMSVAAPELYGRWDIAPMIGIKKENGEIDRSNAVLLGTTGVILDQSEKKDAAWEFLKWWTSAETQIRFGRELEALLGVESRWNSANVEAFSGIPWNRKHLQVIKESQAWANEQPIVLGGYFTSRHITNAFNRVVVSYKMNARDSIEKAVKDINAELRAKQEEYGVKVE